MALMQSAEQFVRLSTVIVHVLVESRRRAVVFRGPGHRLSECDGSPRHRWV